MIRHRPALARRTRRVRRAGKDLKEGIEDSNLFFLRPAVALFWRLSDLGIFVWGVIRLVGQGQEVEGRLCVKEAPGEP